MFKLVDEISTCAGKIHLDGSAETIFKISLDNLVEQYENFYCQESDEIAEDTLSYVLEQGSTSVKKTL